MKLDPKTLIIAFSLLLGLSFAFPQEGKQQGELPGPGQERKPIPATKPVVTSKAPAADNASKSAALSGRTTSLEAEISALRAEQAAIHSTLKGIVDYLDQRARAAKDLESSLSVVESAGFTSGINPKSREVLLSSWRKFLAQEKVALPVLAPRPTATSTVKTKDRPRGNTSSGARWR